MSRMWLKMVSATAVIGLALTGCDDKVTPEPTVEPGPLPTASTVPVVAGPPTPIASPTPTTAAEATANPWLADGTFESANVQIASGDAQISAHLARPAGTAPGPAVIVIHENRGLVPYIRAVTDGLASNGFLAVAPDLLSREGGTANVGSAQQALRGISDDRHIGDLQAVIAYLEAQPNVTEIGVIGFCFGGGLVWKLATTNPSIAAAVPFYGSNPPIDEVPNIGAAVFGVYGGLDSRINAGLPAITEALAAADIEHQLKVYPDSQHAFHNHTNGSRYNEATAAEAWGEALSWLGSHLRDGAA